MLKYAVIVAGGSGIRMGNSIPKQFLEIAGKPVLLYTINSFLEAFDDLQIVVVLPEQHIETGKAIIDASLDPFRITVAKGGSTRFQSVKNGLEHINKPSIVFVHDAVRCLVSKELIWRCYETAAQKGNAIPAISAVDTIRIETENGNQLIDRNKVHIIQTPQTFQSEILKQAFEQPYEASFTDEASVVERTGIKINLVEGETNNIKITRPLDLVLAEKLIEGVKI
jgi:2-C-methyl-D-erythritol 4-phosphate cytidylyltransferase